MAGRIQDRVAVVTGGCSGIGLATVQRFVEEGAKVVIGDIDDQRGHQLVGQLGGADVATYVHVDVTDKEQVDALFRTAKETYGSVDIAFNNAGISPPEDDSILDTDLDAWRKVQEVNLTGAFLAGQAAARWMVANGGQGAIVNVSSEAGLRGSAAGAAYTASKHAVVGLTKSSAFMYSPSGIRVNAVAPGPVITNIQASFASELGAQRVQQAMTVLPTPVLPDQLAASITFLLSDDGVNVSGAILPSDGGWSAI